MIFIHKALDLLPVLSYPRLIFVILPIVTASGSNSQDFYISSDNLLHNEPQLIIEIDNDQLLQDAFDPSNLNELNVVDKGYLEHISNFDNGNTSNQSLNLTKGEDVSSHLLTGDDYSILQMLPTSVTIGESPKSYTDQHVNSDVQFIATHQNVKLEPSQQQQYTKENNDDTFLNQDPLNHQVNLNQAKHDKLLQNSIDPKIYWEFPTDIYPLPNDYILNDPSNIEDYYTNYDHSFEFDNIIGEINDPRNNWMTTNQGQNVLSNIPYTSTINPNSVSLLNTISPLNIWFDKISNDLTPHIIPQLQNYKNVESKFSEKQILSPNIYQKSNYPSNHFAGNQQNYKPSDSKHYSTLTQDKISIPEPLNTITPLNQYSNDKIVRPTFEQYPDLIAPEVLPDYNQGNMYQYNQMEPSYNVPFGHNLETETVYYDPVDIGSDPQLAYNDPITKPEIDSPLSLGQNTKPNTADNAQIDQGSNYQEVGVYGNHAPLYQSNIIAAADDIPHAYSIVKVNPVGQFMTPQTGKALYLNNPIDQEWKSHASNNSLEIPLKDQTIKSEAVDTIDTNPINQAHNYNAYSRHAYIVPKDQGSEFKAIIDIITNLDPTYPNSVSHTVDDNHPNDQIKQNIKPYYYDIYSHNIPKYLHGETQENVVNLHDKSWNKENKPGEIKNKILTAPIKQRDATRPFDSHSYNMAIEHINLTKGEYTNQHTSLNQDNQSLVSEKLINKIMNEPWAWFKEHPGVKEIHPKINSDIHHNADMEVNNEININKKSEVQVDHTLDIKHHKDSNLQEKQQSVFDNADILNSHTNINQIDDQESRLEFKQKHHQQFSGDETNTIVTDELIDKQDDAVKSSLLLSRILDDVLHLVEENEEDVNSRTSSLFGYRKVIEVPIVSDIDTTDVWQKILADQIRMWDNPEIYINQPLDDGHVSRIDQNIRNDQPTISPNHDNQWNLASYQDYYSDLSIEDLLSKMDDDNPPLIPIDLSNGILQSTGNTTNSDSPYLAVDYGSPSRYNTFWNPQDQPFGFSGYYIIFDFKTIYTVTKMYIMNYGDAVHDITAFKLEVWDGQGKWQMISNFFSQPGISKDQEFGGFTGTGRYWKFTAIKTVSGYQPWLVELGFYGVVDYGEYQDYFDDSSSDIPTELYQSSDSEETPLSEAVAAEQNGDSHAHTPTWIYYLVGLVVLAVAMFSMTCLVMCMAKKRNGLYNITLVMGKGKEDKVTPQGGHPTKDFTASAPPALPPASVAEVEADSKTDPDKNAVTNDINKVKWIFN